MDEECVIYRISITESCCTEGRFTKCLMDLFRKCDHSLQDQCDFITNYGNIKIRIYNFYPYPEPHGYIFIFDEFNIQNIKSINNLLSFVGPAKIIIYNTGNNFLNEVNRKEIENWCKYKVHFISLEKEDNILEPFEDLLRILTRKEDIEILNYEELQNKCYVKPALKRNINLVNEMMNEISLS